MTLKISYPHIFNNRVQDSTYNGGAVRFGTSWKDTSNGERSARPYITTNSGSYMTYAVDLGVGNTATADHLMLTHIDAYSAVTSITVYNSNTSISSGYGGLNSAASYPASYTGIGPRGEDYYLAVNMPTPARYWACEITTSSPSTNVRLGKIYLGTGFDMGKPPEEFLWERVPEKIAESRTTSGNYERQRASEYKYKFTFQWGAITDAKVAEFMGIMEDSHRDRYFLYTTDLHHLLNDERLVHVKLTNVTTENSAGKADWNRITAEFEELVG